MRVPAAAGGLTQALLDLCRSSPVAVECFAPVEARFAASAAVHHSCSCETADVVVVVAVGAVVAADAVAVGEAARIDQVVVEE